MAQPAGEVPPAIPAPARAGRQQQQQGLGQSLSGIIRMAVIWYFAMKFFAPKKPSEPSIPISNLFQKGELLVCPASSFAFFFLACFLLSLFLEFLINCYFRFGVWEFVVMVICEWIRDVGFMEDS